MVCTSTPPVERNHRRGRKHAIIDIEVNEVVLDAQNDVVAYRVFKTHTGRPTVFALARGARGRRSSKREAKIHIRRGVAGFGVCQQIVVGVAKPARSQQEIADFAGARHRDAEERSVGGHVSVEAGIGHFDAGDHIAPLFLQADLHASGKTVTAMLDLAGTSDGPLAAHEGHPGVSAQIKRRSNHDPK